LNSSRSELNGHSFADRYFPRFHIEILSDVHGIVKRAKRIDKEFELVIMEFIRPVAAEE
jgi:hypothetical protein